VISTSVVDALDPSRTVAELRELAALTSDERGAQRVAWGPVWREARGWLRERLDALGLDVRTDAAGNTWATLRGRSDELIAIGSHLDSVPDGGWLDGALGVLAGLEVMRALAAGEPPSRSVVLIDWADEEGARFGHSLLGSSAAAGLLDVEAARGLSDRDGVALADALAEHEVELERMPDAAEERPELAAYLELHIEQGPVLEREGLPLAAVRGCFGVRRERVRFGGESAHAGATPLELRHDPVLAAARFALAAREAAREHGGLATVGAVQAEPGIPTAVAAACTATVDLRHEDPDALAALHAATRAAARAAAEPERTTVEAEPLWSIDPIPFDAGLVEAASEVVSELGGRAEPLPSGALHDAAAMARAGVPTVMLFVQSRGGLSHTAAEDTDEAHLELAVRALAGLTARVMEGRRPV
jgi:beta-ureidopropionase / N-carbamoyl-L-amino-acid hydrolase